MPAVKDDEHLESGFTDGKPSFDESSEALAERRRLREPVFVERRDSECGFSERSRVRGERWTTRWVVRQA